MSSDFRYGFLNDYSEVAHPRLLQALSALGGEQNPGYGLDPHSRRASELIRAQLGTARVDIHLLVGGTQTNLAAISSFLRPHQAAIAVPSGHIATHETGAIEATGHKVVAAAAAAGGKLTPDAVEHVLQEHTDEHMVQPRLVYVSDSTELGAIYTRDELRALSDFCHARGLLLYLDGARLGSALVAQGNDLTLADIAAFTDAFYIGGTKNGALAGEALVVVNDALKPDLRYLIKQRGAMLAKGAVLGVQFSTLFEDGLYFELARHANSMAARLQSVLENAGVAFASVSPTNQIFPVLPSGWVDRLAESYDFIRWQKLPNGMEVIRLVTSWATQEQAVDAFCQDITVLAR